MNSNLRGFLFKEIITTLKGGLVLIHREALELYTQMRFILFLFCHSQNTGGLVIRLLSGSKIGQAWFLLMH